MPSLPTSQTTVSPAKREHLLGYCLGEEEAQKASYQGYITVTGQNQGNVEGNLHP